MVTKFFSSNKFPLFIAITVQLIDLLSFTSRKVQPILPTGNNAVLDWIYANQQTINIFFISSIVLAFLTFLLRSDTRVQRGFIIILFLICGWFHTSWILLVLYPLLFSFEKMPKSPKTQKQFSDGSLGYLTLATVLGAFLLMTQQIPYPHVKTDQWLYIHGLSTIYLSLLVSGFLFFYWIWNLICNRIKTFELLFPGVRLFGIITLLFIVFAYYANVQFNPIIKQFSLFQVPYMISGLLVSLIFLLVGPIEGSYRFSGQLFFICHSYVSRRFWIKFILAGMVIRETFGWFVRADKNFLTIFVYDLVNAFFPFFAFWISLGFIFTITKRFAHFRFYKPVPYLILIFSLTIPFLYLTEGWTYQLDLNRPSARFYTKNSRAIIKTIGINTDRESEKKLKILVSGMEQFQNAKDLSMAEVMQHDYQRPVVSPPILSKTPNIFIFVTDGTYAGHLQVYGYHKKNSVNLVKFAKESVLFKHFYSSSSATFAALGSLLTGKYIGNFPDRTATNQKTICDLLNKKKYIGFFATTFGSASISNTAKNLCYQHTKLSYQGISKTDWEKIADAHQKYPNQPIFSYFHVKGGHDPWSQPEKDLIFGSGKIDQYDALLYKMDRQFGEMIQKIKTMGRYENSIIIFIGDHGIGLGKHLDQVSYDKLYNVNIQIPFIVKVPGITPSVIDNFYSMVDVLPSLEELLGLKVSQNPHGISFVPELIEKRETNHRCVFSVATYRDRIAQQCSSGEKIYYNRSQGWVEVFNTKKDHYELESIINQYSDTQFDQLTKPLQKFLAFGKETYAKPF
jgi:hypothetical protein